MTYRATRAAEELRRRGWQIDDSDDAELDRECQQCGYQMRADSRFCQNCGARVVVGVAECAQSDLEAAIAAAVDANRLRSDAMSIFNDPPSETPQAVRDVIEWYDASLRA